MAISFTKRTLFSGVLMASTLTTMAYAEPSKSGFTLTPSLGFYNTDNDRDAGNDHYYALGLGYQFNSPLAIEATYLHSDARKRGRDHDLDQYRVDGLYSLPKFTQVDLTPYLAAGVGLTDVDGTDSSTNLFINAGGGVKYALNQDVSLRADFRLVKDIEDNYLDNVASIGVQYAFGEPALQYSN
ncbi:porin family protein [Marinomonas posidonica]|uniref:porin family protein n=1 Tax=Marinomonas posidonica TaxID=936476 RepID=UPI0037357F76